MSDNERESLIRRAKIADQIADNCRPNNPHRIPFRKEAFELRERARSVDTNTSEVNDT